MKQVLFNEWHSLARRGYVLLFIVVPLGVSAFLGLQDAQMQQNRQLEAQRHIRKQWENMGPSNPHNVAHFGSYAFKPVNALTALDEGINSSVGNVLRLEGHVQNEMTYSPGSQTLMLSRFGPLKPALLLQILIPLVLIFLAFSSVSGEREQGRFSLLALQGLSARNLLLGKLFAYWLIGTALLLLTLGTQWLFFTGNQPEDLLVRSSILFLVYAAFYWIICALTVWLSARLKNGAAALTSMLALWALWVFFLPKIGGTLAESAHPLPSRQDFKTAMQEDRSQGIDGHNPSDEREKKLRDSVLTAYGVDSVAALPINFDGIVMQADEEYGNQVWDKHFGALFQTLQQQKQTYQLSGFVNPFAALQSLSMGACGTDHLHHAHFQQAAESYRRNLIKALNDKHAFGGSKTGDWSWEADQAFFNSIADFKYKGTPLAGLFSHYIPDLAALMTWILLSTLVLYRGAAKINEPQ